MTISISIAVIAALTWIGYKTRFPVFWLILFGVCMVMAFKMPNLLNGASVTSEMGIALGFGTMLYAFICAAFGITMMFTSDEDY